MDDLPNEITALAGSNQDFCTDAEKEKAKTLRSNHQANLATISSKISLIDEEIGRLQSHRETLLPKRDRELSNIAILEATLNPLRRVPSEVLCEIFLCCLSDTGCAAPTLDMVRAARTVLSLCQVCSKWRRTALEFPPLWKALGIRTKCTLKDQTTMIHPAVSSVLEIWFARAGSCVLSLGLVLFPSTGFLETSRLTLRLKNLLEQLSDSRLQHLSLTTVHVGDAYFLSQIFREFRELESIFLSSEFHSWYPHMMPRPTRLLRSAPRLRSAELHNFIHHFSPMFLPWSQLTHLHVEGGFTESMWYSLIGYCTNLRHGVFSVDCSANDPMIVTSNHNSIFPHLVDLTVHAVTSKTPKFRQLVFPALQRLQLLSDWTLPEVYQWNSAYFPRGYTSSLTKLVLIGPTFFTESQVQSFLQTLPSLTEFHLSITLNYLTFLDALINTQFLPKLETFHCDIQKIGRSDSRILQQLISFVQSRVSDPHTTCLAVQLRHLSLKFPVGWDYVDHLHQILAPFRDQGLLLVLGTIKDDHPDFKKMMRYDLDL